MSAFGLLMPEKKHIPRLHSYRNLTPFHAEKHTIIEHCVKNQLIRLRTLVEEAFGITLPQVNIANNCYSCSLGGDEWVPYSLAVCEPICLPACNG